MTLHLWQHRYLTPSGTRKVHRRVTLTARSVSLHLPNHLTVHLVSCLTHIFILTSVFQIQHFLRLLAVYFLALINQRLMHLLPVVVLGVEGVFKDVGNYVDGGLLRVPCHRLVRSWFLTQLSGSFDFGRGLRVLCVESLPSLRRRKCFIEFPALKLGCDSSVELVSEA